MEPPDAILLVLRSAEEPLHWTVIQDRALREGYLDPFEIRDVRGEILTSLRTLVDRGDVDRVGKGTYRLPEAIDEGPDGEPGGDPQT
ncbi:MAG TPA: hypothetical protein VI341_03820 [Actinomycetota bacterium]